MGRKEKSLRGNVPKAGRPYMPGYEMMFKKGRATSPWSWTANQLAKSHNYWLSTTRPDGRPHVMPIWGLWLDNMFYFSTGPRSRKARNLSQNPNCAVCTEDTAEAVVLEGTAQMLPRGWPLNVSQAYEKKYKWKVDKEQSPFYAITPRATFGFVEGGTFDPIRWSFDTRK